MAAVRFAIASAGVIASELVADSEATAVDLGNEGHWAAQMMPPSRGRQRPRLGAVPYRAMQDGLASAPTARPWRKALLVIGATFVASRVLLVLIALIVEFALPLDYARPSYSSSPILASLTGSDSVYLLGIAASGYHALPISQNYLDWAFFPLYPMVVRVASLVTFGDLAWAGVLISNLATLGGAWLLYRLGELRLGHRRALLAVVYLLIAPGAVAFGMAYTDSLFLVLALAAVYAAERSRWGLMGVFYGLATLTRLPGIFLIVPLLLIVLASERRSIRAAVPLFLGPLALGGFTLYLWQQFGVWFAYLQAQASWSNPANTVAGGGLPAGVEPLVALLIGTLLLYVFLLVYMRPDRLDISSISYVIVSLLTVIGSLRLLSVGRYLAVVWPFSWLLAGRGGVVPVLWPAMSGALFSLYALLHFTQTLAP